MAQDAHSRAADQERRIRTRTLDDPSFSGLPRESTPPYPDTALVGIQAAGALGKSAKDPGATNLKLFSFALPQHFIGWRRFPTKGRVKGPRSGVSLRFRAV